MPTAVKLNLPALAAAAICSGSALVGLMGWIRNDAVTQRRVEAAERQIDAMTKQRQDDHDLLMRIDERLRGIPSTAALK